MDVGILILIPILLIGIMVFLYVVPLGLWVSALAAGVNVGIFTLVGTLQVVTLTALWML